MLFESWAEFIEDQRKASGSWSASSGYGYSEGHCILASCPGDPLHSGHIDYLNGAKRLTNISEHSTLIVIVNDDDFLTRKKGYKLLPLKERLFIIDRLNLAKFVIGYGKADNVSECIRYFKPYIFANGGDRTGDNANEEEIQACKETGTILAYGVGGYKKQGSSSEYFKEAFEQYVRSRIGK